MATYHSLNVALGLSTAQFTQGLQQAGSQLKQFATGGLNVRGLVQFATASYGVTRAVNAISEGSKEIAEQLRASDTEASRLYETMNGVAMASETAVSNLQKYGFVVGGIKSGAQAIVDWWKGDVPGRDTQADAVAADQLKKRQAEQARYKEENDWKFKEDSMLGKLRNDLTGEEELNKLGTRERRVVEARRGFGGLPSPDDAALRQMARDADQAEKQRELSKRNTEKRVAGALGVIADEQERGRSKSSRGGGGGSTAALLLGSKEEYVARMKALNQSDPDKKDDRRHKREVERAQKETNKWLRKLLDAQGALSIPGGV